jgi:hypothetical protein
MSINFLSKHFHANTIEKMAGNWRLSHAATRHGNPVIVVSAAMPILAIMRPTYLVRDSIDFFDVLSVAKFISADAAFPRGSYYENIFALS